MASVLILAFVVHLLAGQDSSHCPCCTTDLVDRALSDICGEESNHINNTMASTTDKALKYDQDGEEAREIAKYLPYFPFKGIPRFYDIGGFLYEPAIFQKIVDIFAERYAEIGIDVIAGYVLFVMSFVNMR